MSFGFLGQAQSDDAECHGCRRTGRVRIGYHPVAAIFGPKDMAPERVAFLEQAFRRAAESNGYCTAMEARGEVAVGSTAEELKARVAIEDVQLGAIVKSLGIGK